MYGTRTLSCIALALTATTGVGLTNVETALASPGDTPARITSNPLPGPDVEQLPDASRVRRTPLYDEWTGRNVLGYYRFTRFTRLGTRVVNAAWDRAETWRLGPELLCAVIARPLPLPSQRCVRYVRAHRSHVDRTLNAAVSTRRSFQADTKLFGPVRSPAYVFSAVRSVR